MSYRKIAAAALLLTGVLAVLYGSFGYTREASTTRMGVFEVTLKDRRTVNVPIWAGVAAVVTGGLMLVVPRRKG